MTKPSNTHHDGDAEADHGDPEGPPGAAGDQAAVFNELVPDKKCRAREDEPETLKAQQISCQIAIRETSGPQGAQRSTCFMFMLIEPRDLLFDGGGSQGTNVARVKTMSVNSGCR